MKKISALCLIIYLLGLTACGRWDNLHSKSEIISIFSEKYLTDIELVSSNKSRGRAEYVFRDGNGIKFTVIEELEASGFGMILSRYSNIYSDYALRLLDPHIEEIKTKFEEVDSSFEPEVYPQSEYFKFIVDIKSFEQIPNIIAALEKTLNLVPPMPITKTDSDGISRPTPYIGFSIVDEEHSWNFCPRIMFPMTDEITPGSDKVLVRIDNETDSYDWDRVRVLLENGAASYFKKNPDIEFQIPYDVLMREPPESFNSVIFVEGDEEKEISGLSVSWEDGRYTFPAPIFHGNRGFFVEMIRELGGSHEYISFESESLHLKWEISGDMWEARKIGDDINITKNGNTLLVQTPNRPCMHDIEVMLGVRGEYTNDVAILYLIKE